MTLPSELVAEVAWWVSWHYSCPWLRGRPEEVANAARQYIEESRGDVLALLGCDRQSGAEVGAAVARLALVVSRWCEEELAFQSVDRR